MPKAKASAALQKDKGWTVSELKDALGDLGLSKSGNKQELMKRLEIALGGDGSTNLDSNATDYPSAQDKVKSSKSKSSRSKLSKTSGKHIPTVIEAELSLWASPITTVAYFFAELYDLALKAVSYALSHRISVAFLSTFLISFLVARTVNGPYQQVALVYEDAFFWYSYWVILGIASSIGLGTGLHTFVLFLGPFIARVTMVGYECGNLDFKTRGLVGETFVCQKPNSAAALTMLAIYFKVLFESFAWGAGTAIGELPPYFVARAAALAGKEDEEFDHIQALQQKKKRTTLSQRLFRPNSAVHVCHDEENGVLWYPIQRLNPESSLRFSGNHLWPFYGPVFDIFWSDFHRQSPY